MDVLAEDDSGNQSTCSFDVTVQDTTAPNVTCPTDVVAEATSASGATVNYDAATAIDAVNYHVVVQDTAEQAVALHGQASATDQQRSGAFGLIRHPVLDADAEAKFVDEVLSYDGAYEWRP